MAVGENQFQILEFVSTKQSKVCRSTFAAELHNCSGAIGSASGLRHQVIVASQGQGSFAAALAAKQDAGAHSLTSWLCRGVQLLWDSASQQLVKIHLRKPLVQDSPQGTCPAMGLCTYLLWFESETEEYLREACRSSRVN